MWLLNLDKKVKIILDKNNYLEGDIVKWKVSFDFWNEKLKMNKIFITFRQKTIIERKVYENWSYNYRKNINYNNILQKVLKNSGEYNKENLNFEFTIPNNLLYNNLNIQLKIKNLFKKYKIPLFLFDLLKIFLFSTTFNQSIYEIEARLDIPWGKDIIFVEQIEILNKK